MYSGKRINPCKLSNLNLLTMYNKVDLFMDAVNLQRGCVVCACYQCTMWLRFLYMLIMYNEVALFLHAINVQQGCVVNACFNVVVVYVTFHFFEMEPLTESDLCHMSIMEIWGSKQK